MPLSSCSLALSLSRSLSSPSSFSHFTTLGARHLPYFVSHLEEDSDKPSGSGSSKDVRPKSLTVASPATQLNPDEWYPGKMCPENDLMLTHPSWGNTGKGKAMKSRGGWGGCGLVDVGRIVVG